MIKMNSTVIINAAKIAKLTAAQTVALAQTAEALHTEVIQAQVIPFDSGNLQNESSFVDESNIRNGVATLVHASPYARRMYFHPEYKFSKKENPNAQGEWYKDWMPGGRYEKFAPRAFKEFYRRAGGL